MIGIIIILIAAIAGIFAGLSFDIPYTYTLYLAIAIISCLDSVFGGIAANLQKRFDLRIFISGFFGNAIIATGLVYLGEKLNVDLYLAAILVFGNRMFMNFSIIRRHFFNKQDDEIMHEHIEINKSEEK